MNKERSGPTGQTTTDKEQMQSMPLRLSEVKRYLRRRTGASVKIESMQELGGVTSGAEALKQFGYGRPFLVSYRVGDREERLVFHRVRQNSFGREREDDRVAAVWLDFKTFNRLPHHVPAADKVTLTEEGKIQSIGAAKEVLLLTEYRHGHPYADDLKRIRDQGTATTEDVKRAETLAAYLAEIHEVRHEDASLWHRRLRDLIGHGEGIMGLTDSYPIDAVYAPPEDLRGIEEKANHWRWRLKPFGHRLRQVHGDFHPFNVLFDKTGEFHILDRSRGEWGEPADDVSCMTINYLFFSVQRSGRLEGPFSDLHERFWRNYLTLRLDEELRLVIQPWLAWRALVLASPVWYPSLSEQIRRKLLTFAQRVLEIERYDFLHINQYLEGI